MAEMEKPLAITQLSRQPQDYQQENPRLGQAGGRWAGRRPDIPSRRVVHDGGQRGFWR